MGNGVLYGFCLILTRTQHGSVNAQRPTRNFYPTRYRTLIRVMEDFSLAIPYYFHLLKSVVLSNLRILISWLYICKLAVYRYVYVVYILLIVLCTYVCCLHYKMDGYNKHANTYVYIKYRALSMKKFFLSMEIIKNLKCMIIFKQTGL